MKEQQEKKEFKYFINDEINRNEILLVLENETLKLTKNEALEKAAESNLDLVCMQTKGNLAVCKLMNFNKFIFEKKKKDKELAKKQAKNETRKHTVQLSPTIGDSDIKYRAKKAREWLLSKDVVNIEILFKGRMITHKDFGIDKINKFIEYLELQVKFIKEPSFDNDSSKQMKATIVLAE